MDRETDVIKLIPKKKKGALRIVFSRVGLVVLLLAIQVGGMFLAYRWFSDSFGWFKLVQEIFSLGMVFYLFNCTMDATAKLTWLVLIMFLPVPAALMLCFTKMDWGHRYVKKRTAQLIKQSRHQIEQDPEALAHAPLEVQDLCRYLNGSGCFPIYERTEVTYMAQGEEKFAALLSELEKAETFIFLEYFIVDEGYMWSNILKILADKARHGVDVRLMYDGMCEVSLLPHDYPKRMAKLGIKCKPFTPITPFVSTQYNYRDHRKILVIDGKVAFNGGINLADEYINRVRRFGHWKDTAVMLRGEAVQSFTLMFLQMWNLDEKEPQWAPCVTSYQADTDGLVMPYADCPLDGDKAGEIVYMDLLNRARRYVYIMTPYLILDNELETAFQFAARRGVDVRLILPGIPDKKTAYALAKLHYRALIKAGVKIYEYTPGFVHAKVFVSDDEKAVVGTINLDYRSLYHHFECATYLYRTSCIRRMRQDFEETLAKCREVTEDTIRKEKWFYRILGRLMKLFAPLM